jgi:RNA polymerase sigma-70 factor (ECF subfamily)
LESVTEVKPPIQSMGVEQSMRVVPGGGGRSPDEGPEPISEDEFRAIYEAQFDYVYHSLRRLGAPDGDIEDLAHDVFVVLYRGRADYDRARPIRPWLFGIAFRVSSDFRRRARHRFEVPDDSREFADQAPGAEERLSVAEDKALVREGLQALDLDRRAVFVMHDLDGHAMPEIAAALGVPLNTAYSRLRLAREQFALVIRRKKLQREARFP